MGIETLILGGLALARASSAMSASKKEARALVQEGEFAAKEKSKETRFKAARVTSRFLNSGVTLEGTPMAAISGIYDVGLEDVEAIRGNYNTRAKNRISAGRSAAIDSLMSTAAMAAGGGAFDGMINGVGQDIGFMTSNSGAYGPFKPMWE